MLMIAVNPVEQMARARDGGRKQAVSEIVSAMQRYQTNRATYPAEGSWISTILSSGELKKEPNLIAGGTQCNLNAQNGYCYATNGTEATIFVRLESASEASRCTVSPNTTPYFMWVSTTNTTSLYCSTDPALSPLAATPTPTPGPTATPTPTPTPNPVPLALDTASTGTAATNNTISYTHTITPGIVNRLLLVGITEWTGTYKTVTSLTYAGQALTKIGSVTPGTAPTSEIWYLLNPPTGANTVSVTFSGTVDAVAGSTSWKGVNQTTPLGTYTSASGNSISPSVTVSSATGEIVVDALATGPVTTTDIVSSGQVQLYNTYGGNNRGTGSQEAGSASTSMSWTQNISERWAISAVPIKPN